ncbi:116_t:CDS:1, partial [Gigaspora margarita]
LKVVKHKDLLNIDNLGLVVYSNFVLLVSIYLVGVKDHLLIS